MGVVVRSARAFGFVSRALVASQVSMFARPLIISPVCNLLGWLELSERMSYSGLPPTARFSETFNQKPCPEASFRTIGGVGRVEAGG